MDRGADRALCRQIADDLREGIQRGIWEPGERLPSHSAIAKQYGCHSDTARSAVRIIVHEGLAVTEPRVGTTVTGDDPRMIVEVRAPVRITARMPTQAERQDYGLRPGVPFLEIEHPAGHPDDEALIERHPAHTTTVEVNG